MYLFNLRLRLQVDSKVDSKLDSMFLSFLNY